MALIERTAYSRLRIEHLAELDAILDPRPFLAGVAHMRHIRNAAQKKLQTLQEQHRSLSESLLSVFGDLLRQARDTGSDVDLGQRVRAVLDEGVRQRHARRKRLTPLIDLGFASQRWQNFVLVRDLDEPTMTEVLNTTAAEGYQVTKELVGRLSPYMRKHIRRFGQYVLDMDEIPEPLEPEALKLSGCDRLQRACDNFLHVSCTSPSFASGAQSLAKEAPSRYVTCAVFQAFFSPCLRVSV